MNLSSQTMEEANAWYTSSDGSEVIPMIVDGQESLFLVEFCHKYNCSIKVVYGKILRIFL